MQASFLAALARPGWWAVALAAFLLRGGFLLIILPIVSLPTVANLTTLIGPTVQDMLLGGPSLESLLLGSAVLGAALVVVYALAYAGSWLDLQLVREATADDDVDLGWSLANPSPAAGLGLRLVAHIPTAMALGYASIRIVDAVYLELTSPGNAVIPLPVRVLGHLPNALISLGVAWLVGEAVGGLAARRVAAGEPVWGALGRSIRQVVSPRGLATLAVTSGALAALLVPFVVSTQTAWRSVRVSLYDGLDPAITLAAVVLLVGTWVLGLTVLGALLAWRATAWTLQIAPRKAAVTPELVRASEPSR
jgi:hypothetical protein